MRSTTAHLLIATVAMGLPACRRGGERRSELGGAAYPIVAISGKAGDYVLAPSRTWIDEALERGGDVPGGTADSPKVRYLDMDLENPSSFGPKESTLRSAASR